jgi:glycosyltransferase involved in cell wall biosynthesis
MSEVVTVAIPVRDGGAILEQTLGMVCAQRLDPPCPLELVVCDSGSRDGSPELARRFGADVIAIAPERFSHGGTRNLLMERSCGSHVAFLTQDAVPADELWLSRLLSAFSLAPDVALSFGPYRPRANASPMVARELTQWFGSFSSADRPRLDRLEVHERGSDSRALMGARAYFTDANGCVARPAWERVRFPDVRYAEDHALALQMLRAGYAKVYEPEAAVIHSHEYSAWGWLRRSFDESRALREVYGWVPPLDPRTMGLNLWGRVGADRRWMQAHRTGDLGRTDAMAALARSTAHHAARLTGAALGARSERLTPALARQLSLERRVG